MPNRPYSVLSKGERNALDLLDTDALLAHYEDVYASRFRWEGGPEGMDPSWPERMIYRYGLLGVAEAFGEQQLAGGHPGRMDEGPRRPDRLCSLRSEERNRTAMPDHGGGVADHAAEC